MKNTHQIDLTKRPAQPGADKEQSVQQWLDQCQKLQSLLEKEILSIENKARLGEINSISKNASMTKYLIEKKKTRCL